MNAGLAMNEVALREQASAARFAQSVKYFQRISPVQVLSGNIPRLRVRVGSSTAPVLVAGFARDGFRSTTGICSKPERIIT
jgi:hypothetical protein